MPGLPVHHQLPEFTQTHVHRVGDAIQPSHPLLSPSPPAPNPSQHQSLFQISKSATDKLKTQERQWLGSRGRQEKIYISAEGQILHILQMKALLQSCMDQVYYTLFPTVLLLFFKVKPPSLGTTNSYFLQLFWGEDSRDAKTGCECFSETKPCCIHAEMKRRAFFV
ncbi:hypothetical protein AB1E18_015161 [Capra hircus]